MAPNSLNNISAAGIPSGVVSNTSTRNMQTKVHNKVLLGHTEDQYDKNSAMRTSKESYRRDYELDSAGDLRESPTAMGSRRKRGVMALNS